MQTWLQQRQQLVGVDDEEMIAEGADR